MRLYFINTNQTSNSQLINVLTAGREKDISKKLIRNLTTASQDKEAGSIINNTTVNQSTSKLLSSSEQKEAMAELTEDFTKLKESFNINIYEDDSKWLNYHIPLYDCENVTDQKISINQKPNE